jgi:uncharacterized protein HemX
MPVVACSGTRRRRYYVEDPQVILRLSDLERLVDHLSEWKALNGLSPAEQKRLQNDRRVWIEELRQQLTDTKAHYRIK